MKNYKLLIINHDIFRFLVTCSLPQLKNRPNFNVKLRDDSQGTKDIGELI